MNDTDKIIAAIFAATLSAKQSDPTAHDFFLHFDACVAEMAERAVIVDALKVQQTQAAHRKAWGEC